MQKEEKVYQPLFEPEVNWQSIDDEASVAELTISPLEPGFGITLGNSLRRILLSFIEGSAVTSIIVEGINHEFSVLNGVVEDVSQIILAIKQLRIKNETGQPGVLHILKRGSGVVTAADISGDSHLAILNKELKIATLASDGILDIKLFVEVGRGFKFAAWPAGTKFYEDGKIFIDALFSPILNVAYSVEKARRDEDLGYDKLVMKIKTNGAIEPAEAVRYASSVLRENCKFLLLGKNDIDFSSHESNIEEENDSNNESDINKSIVGVSVDLFTKSIYELELSVRARNCLDGANIKNVLDLVNLNIEESLKIKNFGKKTLKEVVDVLTKLGLRLGMNIKTQDLKKARKENASININKFG